MEQNPGMCPSVKVLKESHPQLFELSDLRGMLAVFSDWAQIIVVVLISVFAQNWWVYFAAIFFVGFKQCCLGESLVHHSSHFTLFRSRWLQGVMEFFFATPFFQSAHDYRTDHIRHHKHVTTDRDPTFRLFKFLGLDDPKLNLVWTVIIRPFTGGITIDYLFKYLPAKFKQDHWKAKVKVIAFYSITLGIFCYFNQLHIPLLYWFVPFLFIQRQIVFINEVVEHYRVEGIARQRTGWINLFMHNDGYHYLHHLYPTIPWFRLPQAYKILKPNLPKIETCSGFALHALLNMLKNSSVPFYPNQRLPRAKGRVLSLAHDTYETT